MGNSVANSIPALFAGRGSQVSCLKRSDLRPTIYEMRANPPVAQD